MGKNVETDSDMDIGDYDKHKDFVEIEIHETQDFTK